MDGGKRLPGAARHMSRRAAERAGRSIHITGAACLGNTAVGVGKLAMGLSSLSLFPRVGALYTFGMVTAKCVALAGIVKSESDREQYRYYKASGVILIVSSVLYAVYSARLFFYPESGSYHAYIALGIAAVTFAELTLNIRGVIIERKNHTQLVHAIKMLNLASSLICLVLTQTAILSFASGRAKIHPAANGLLGVLMGGAATLLGAAMIVRILRIEKKGARA